METKVNENCLTVHYRWCPTCAASIKSNATYCRFCQKYISPEEQTSDFKSVNLANAQACIEECRHWLIDLDKLISHLPDSQYKEHLLLAIALPSNLKKTGITKEEAGQFRQSNIGITSPISLPARAILFELLYNLLEAGFNLDPILETAKLRLLGINKTTLQEEIQLRETELKQNHLCSFCGEYNIQTAQQCRHCFSDFRHPPPLRSTIDIDYLHDVLIHIISERADSSGYWRLSLELESLDLEPIFTKAGIDEAEIKSALKEKREKYSPFKSVWLQAVIEAGLGDGLEDYHALHEMLNLGKNLSIEKRFAEAELVLNHVMFLARHHKDTGSLPGGQTMLTGLIRNCTHQLSMLFEETERYSEAEEFHLDFANETDFSCIAELNKAFQTMAESVTPVSLIRQGNLSFKQKRLEEAEALYLRALSGFDRIPKKKVKYIDNRQCNEIVQQLKAALGGFATLDGSSANRAHESDAAYNVEISQHLNALSGLIDVYFAKHDLTKAQELLSEAKLLIESLESDQWVGEKVEIWSREAEIYMQQNRPLEAVPLLEFSINSLEKVAHHMQMRPKNINTLLVDLKDRLKEAQQI